MRSALSQQLSTRRLALLAIGVVLVAGCASVNGVAVDQATTATTTGTGSGTTDPGTTSTGPADIGQIPAGLDAYYTQTLDWGPCSEYAASDLDQQTYASPKLECARMKVPVDYTTPDGRAAEIGVLRARSTGAADQRIGSVIFNPGGPGGSGMSLVAQFAAYGVASKLQERFDLVGFDPRGTGASLPIVQCSTDAERDAIRAANLRTSTAAGIAALDDQAKQTAERCVERTGQPQGIDGTTFLANVGTRDSARDIDVLRAVVGDRKLTFVGFSYGTRLGTEYAEKFTSNVRAMILDGAVDPTEDSRTSLIAQATSFQKTFEAFAASCAKTSGCALGAAATDPDHATTAFQKLVRPLLAKPLTLTDGRTLTFNDAVTGTIQAMYSDALWPTLRTALDGVKAGKGDALMSLADQYEDRDTTGKYSPLQDAFTAINCVDRAGTDATDGSLEKEYNAAAPFTDPGDPMVHTKSVCDYWPVPTTYTPHTPKARGLTKVLVISTTGDPATPYQAGVDLAKDLDGSLLTVKGDRHTAYLGAGISCADEIGTAYLEDLQLPDAGTTCS